MKYKNLILPILFILCLVGCSKAENIITNEQNTKEPDVLESSTEELSGESMQVANPWRESSEAEIEELMHIEIDLPGDFSNVYYQVMNEGELCEIDFDYLDLTFTYRMKETNGREDISGMYYDWDMEDTADFHGYEAYASRAVTDEETADLFEWYDKDGGNMYSLGTTAKDLDGFDIQAVAEMLIEDTTEGETEDMSMTDKIEVFAQNSIRIRDRIGNIYIDPFQMTESPNDADIILITHEHYDHYSPDDIRKVVGENTVLVIPESMEDKISDVSGLMKRIVTVKPGTFHEVSGLEFETVPAYNTMKSYHPKSAEWVGYILRLDDKRIYIAGDTDETKEAKAVKCDIALVPIGGTFTMDPKQAADLVNTIRPDVAIPVHYGSVVGAPEDADRFEEKVKEPVKVEKKIDDYKR